MRINEQVIPKVVRQTEGFSFAYMKELFVASMVQWMSNSGKASMDKILVAQVRLLRSQGNMKKVKRKKH